MSSSLDIPFKTHQTALTRGLKLIDYYNSIIIFIIAKLFILCYHDDDSDEAGQHDDRLEGVGPDHRLDTALRAVTERHHQMLPPCKQSLTATIK